MPLSKIKPTWHIEVDTRLHPLISVIQTILLLSNFGFDVEEMPECHARWKWQYQLTHDSKSAFTAFMMLYPGDVTDLITVVWERECL